MRTSSKIKSGLRRTICIKALTESLIVKLKSFHHLNNGLVPLTLLGYHLRKQFVSALWGEAGISPNRLPVLSALVVLLGAASLCSDCGGRVGLW